MSKRNDISQQIQKYLNGELDAHAIHQLEKEAQNDPFLMEALEGYEKSGTDQQSNIDDIRARLEARISKREARIIPWRIISIAASILIALTIGGLWLIHQQPAPEQKIATRVVLPPAKKAPADTVHLKQTLVATLTHQERPKAFVQPNVSEPRAKVRSSSNGNPNADISIDAPVGKADAKVAEYAPVLSFKKDSVPPALRGIAANTANGLSGKVAGVTVNTAPSNNQLAEIVIRGLAPTKKTKELAYSTATITPYTLASVGIKGIVKDESGNPIPGATVKIKGTTIGVQTNTNGYFKLDSVPNKPILDINFIGYESKQVKANKRDSLVIAMQPNNQSLSEVVVVGYGRQREYQSAHPVNGWDEFKKYLKDNAISPDGKTGMVKLSFIVNADNSLSDFKILKSVSAKTDSAAISLIRGGSGWYKNSNNKPEKVKLRIKFTGK